MIYFWLESQAYNKNVATILQLRYLNYISDWFIAIHLRL